MVRGKEGDFASEIAREREGAGVPVEDLCRRGVRIVATELARDFPGKDTAALPSLFCRGVLGDPTTVFLDDNTAMRRGVLELADPALN
jgi:hypothetical protein